MVSFVPKTAAVSDQACSCNGSVCSKTPSRSNKHVNQYLYILIFSVRWVGAESSKYDIEYTVKLRDMQIHDLEMEVSDMRGKFIIPKLKKVHTFKLMDES